MLILALAEGGLRQGRIGPILRIFAIFVVKMGVGPGGGEEAWKQARSTSVLLTISYDFLIRSPRGRRIFTWYS